MKQQTILLLITCMQAQIPNTIKSTRYYYLINLNVEYALYITSSSQQFTKQKAFLLKPEPSLGQVWQIVRLPDNIRFDNCYEIVHARSTLVLTRGNDGEVRLNVGKWLSSQLFKICFIDQDTIQFISNQNSLHLLYFDTALKVGQIDRQDRKCKWIIRPCLDNPIINRSCYFENAFSRMVFDVPRASLSDGCNIIQYTWNNRFNQKFKILHENNFFKILNLNSIKFLTCSKKCKEGDEITQQSRLKTPEQQQWIIQYQGKNLYLIRSAVNLKMVIGPKGNQLKQDVKIVTTADTEFSLWKVVGYMPDISN